MPIVRLTLKGNLAHRCEKLGLEKSWNSLTHNQKMLRKIAWNQAWAPTLPVDSSHDWSEEELEKNLRSLFANLEIPCDVVRPGWGSNAFFYLNHADSEGVFKDMISTGGENFRMIFGDLCSKYILVSSCYEALVLDALGAEHKEPTGRARFLYQRAGQIQERLEGDVPFSGSQSTRTFNNYVSTRPSPCHAKLQCSSGELEELEASANILPWLLPHIIMLRRRLMSTVVEPSRCAHVEGVWASIGEICKYLPDSCCDGEFRKKLLQCDGLEIIRDSLDERVRTVKDAIFASLDDSGSEYES